MQILGKLLKKGFVADSALIMTGTLTSQAANLLATPFLARLYSPIVYGEAAIILSVIGLFGIVACGRYDLAIMLPASDDEGMQVLLVAMFLSSVISLAVGTGYFLIKGASNDSLVSSLIIVAGVFFSGLDLAFNSWGLRRRAFHHLAFARAANGVVAIIIQFLFAYMGQAGPIQLLIGIITGYFASVLINGSLLLEDRALQFRQTLKWNLAIDAARRYRKFPLIEAQGALVNSAAVQLPVFVLTTFFPTEVVGYYSMAYRWIAAPFSLIAKTVSQVFFQRASSLKNQGSGLFRFSWKVYSRLLVVCMMIASPIIFFGEPLFRILLGPEWSQAGIYAQYLSLGLVAQSAFAPASFLFAIMEKQELALVVHLSTFIVPLAGMLAGVHWYTGEPNITILFLGITRMLLYLVLVSWVLSKTHHFERYEQLKISGNNLLT